MSIPFDNTYAKLPEAFYQRVDPSPVSAPKVIALNRDLADSLGIDPEALTAGVLGGNVVPEGADPLGMAYSGHQFGGFSPQLGDGRAILLGEVIDQGGIRRDIQLKGSGPTPWSRRGDGRSALGPVLREYLVSEWMHTVGVPTTRALAAVVSGDRVARETMLPGGVFTRVASSHIRVGTFQYFAARQDLENLKILADYVIERHYPEIRESENPYLELLRSVTERQAALVAHWMSFGFIHGVMNTDNASVSGETIDYGPCAFMDDYDPMKVFSSIDRGGRYAYSNQAPIAQWNLARLAETLLPLVSEDEEESIKLVTGVLEAFPDLYQAELIRRLTAKIGLSQNSEDAWPLVESLLERMTEDKADFTLVFRHLGNDEAFLAQFSDLAATNDWLSRWRAAEPDLDLARQSNPIYIPRNHRIEQVIVAAQTGDFAPFHQLQKVLESPFEDRQEFSDFEAAPEPEEVVQATFCGT